MEFGADMTSPHHKLEVIQRTALGPAITPLLEDPTVIEVMLNLDGRIWVDRFSEWLLPPVVAAPAFAICKPAVAVFTLDDYVAAGIMTSLQAEVLRLNVATRTNILVAGGTSTGKTTLTNALLAEVAKTSDRVVATGLIKAVGM